MLSNEETESLRQRLEKDMGVRIRPRSIRAIRVNSAYHWQPPLYIKVGGSCPYLERDDPPKEILAIFESTTFLVITPDRGLDNNLPYFFAKEDVHQVEYGE